MRIAALACAAAAAVVCAAGCGGKKETSAGPATTAAAAAPSFRGGVLTPAVQATPFTLDDQAGRPVSLADQQGRYVMLAFLYTRCPDVCPAIAGTLNRVLKTPTGKRAGLRVLAISVDPKNDTPAAVRKFAREHQLVPAFRYLIGSRAELQPVWKSFNVAAIPGPGGTVSHSAFELLVDPQGRVRLIYDSKVAASAVVHDLNELQKTG